MTETMFWMRGGWRDVLNGGAGNDTFDRPWRQQCVERGAGDDTLIMFNWHRGRRLRHRYGLPDTNPIRALYDDHQLERRDHNHTM